MGGSTLFILNVLISKRSLIDAADIVKWNILLNPCIFEVWFKYLNIVFFYLYLIR